MERRQLECLRAVVETGSFHRAAERLYLTQSAVSQAVKALETDLGETLIDRGAGRRGGQVMLTTVGALFLPVARDILRRFEEGRQAVAQLRGLLAGRLSIGAVDAAAIYHLPDPLQRFQREHPALEISVRVDGSRPLQEALRQGELDLAFVLIDQPPAGLDGRFFREDPMRVVAPADLLAEAGSDPDPREIAERGWISYPRRSVTRGIIEEAFARAGLPFPVRMEIDRPEAILQLVRAGLGLAVLPELLLDARGRVPGVERLSLPGLEAVRPIRILHRPTSSLSPAARAFLAELD